MRFLSLLRIILCGLVSGTVFSLVNAVLVDKIGSEFLAAAGAHTATGDGTAKTGPVSGHRGRRNLGDVAIYRRSSFIQQRVRGSHRGEPRVVATCESSITKVDTSIGNTAQRLCAAHC
jgi:hypothetical protein